MAVKVIGAGISGLSCGLQLASLGHQVKIFEQNSFVGKSSGENVQAIRNYDLQKDFLLLIKEMGIKLDHIFPITKIVKYAPSGKKMSVLSEDRPLFYSLKRGAEHDSIDAQLYEDAIESGAKVFFNQRKTLKSGDVIAVNSIFKNIWAYGAVFKGVKVAADTILFFMDNKYAPQGYIYVIPYGAHEISIAATSFDLNCPLPVLFQRFLKENNIVSKIIETASFSNYFSGYAYANVPKSAEIKKRKFIGSAAGFIDAARGFGVCYALESGFLAAKAIHEGKSYDALWKAAFSEELLEALRRRFFLEKLTNKEYEKFILGNNVSIKKYEKVPSSLSKILEEIEFTIELSKWQKKFDIEKLFL